MKKTVFGAFILAMLLTACQSAQATQAIEYEPLFIAESGTFSNHLANIRAMGESGLPILSEHDMQLNRLREFAAALNDGGTELYDIRISRIWGHPSGGLSAWCERTERPMQVFFDLTFTHAEDFYNEELIEEMLAFAGISEDEILINLGGVDWIMLWGQVENFDFMLGNQTVYDFVRPYLRLREFAYNINSKTTYRDEAIVTMIQDIHQQQPIGQQLAHYFYPRYEIGLSPAGFANREFVDEMLEFAGLNTSQVRLTSVDAHSWYTEQDFLRANAEMAELYKQHIRFRQFAELVPVRSIRRDIVMDNVWRGMSPAGSRGQGSGFSFSVSETWYDNIELRETLLTFTGIDRDNIDFEIGGIFVAGWTPTRFNLTDEENSQLDLLEEFKAIVNAPFWRDRYVYDPIIVDIGLDGDWDFNTSEFTLRQFVINLYDSNYKDSLRGEIIESIGVENIKLQVFTPWSPFQ